MKSAASATECAQRRPEITPGYEVPESALFSVGDYAQRRPEITPGYEVMEATLSLDGLMSAQRRPEITPGYESKR